ncbi:phosphoribosyltransferase [uncultured Acetatifactor sp.]|jgi:orotate phosphoribosyltransferase|uniref:phosphoribosyltransferase n=1 Tax=uncultured Acetatifactor sp. TaxID=1671927 RepID=UPI0025D83C9A|nr:orotate phosphoribosyltransferase [uncultured Acetatifactor sp.]MCI9650854.1 orotate phosphoribosyltransferase [Lachnospiraceae bacterium]
MQEVIKIYSKAHPNIQLKAIPGHFVTPNSHVNYFLDMTTLKARLSEASMVARELGRQVMISTVVDTIVCIDGCEIIGAFLAEELTRAGIYSRNAHKTIYIITPEYSTSGQMMFRDNYLPMVKDKNVLLLLASATTGKTVSKAIQTLTYYGASISGISAVFSAANSIVGIPVNSLFTTADIPDYTTYSSEKCTMCKEKKPIDAFANAFGYSKIS